MSAAQENVKILTVEGGGAETSNFPERIVRLGYTSVTQAFSAEEALEKAGELSPDLILIDTLLSGPADGLAAAVAIRSHHDFPVVFLAEDADEHRLDEVKLTLPFGYLIKPFTDSALKATIEMALYVSGIDADRRRTEELLRCSEERYRLLVENSAVAIVVAQDGLLKYINPKALFITGFTANELTNTPFTDIIHEEDRAMVVERHIQRLKGEHPPSVYSFRIVSKDGGVRWTEINPVKIDWEGKPATLNFIADITERRLADETLLKHAARLEELEQLINHSPAVVFQWPILPDWPVEFVSENVRLFGYTPDDFYSGRIAFLDIIHQDDRQRVYDEVVRIMNQDVRDFVQEYRIVTAEGDVRWVNDHTWKRYDANGKITHYQGLLIDRTKEMQAWEAKHKLEVQLQQAQKMEAIGTLASGIAHDFNNILQAVSGYIQLLIGKLSTDDSSFRYLAEADSAVERAAELVQQLLTFSRKVEPELKPVDLNRIVDQGVKILQRTIPKMINVECTLAKDLEMVDGDPIQIEHIIMNLGSNAMDAMPKGGRLSIRTETVNLEADSLEDHLAVSPGQYVLLTVTDSGTGIEPAALNHIFEPFYTTKGVGEGTGLGLSMVYGIVKSHNGFITCDSQLGLGTCFNIYLPVKPRELTGIGQDDDVCGDFKGGTETILLVDDERAVLDISKEILVKYGYSVMTADSAEAGLEKYLICSQDVDLVILDLGMPGMGGYGFLARLLTINPSAKVIIASGYSADEHVNTALESGARCFISKPYRLENFLHQVRTTLDGN